MKTNLSAYELGYHQRMSILVSVVQQPVKHYMISYSRSYKNKS